MMRGVLVVLTFLLWFSFIVSALVCLYQMERKGKSLVEPCVVFVWIGLNPKS